MTSASKFTVTNPPQIFWLDLCVIGFFVILNLVNTLFSPPPHEAMYICTTIFVFMPAILLALWTKAFRIEVNGHQIAVRRCFGLVRYNFNVSDIVKVKTKTTDSGLGRIRMMRIYIANGRNIPVENLMVNSDKMMKYIAGFVSSSTVSE